MTKTLNGITVLAGAVSAFIGLWGLIAPAATADPAVAEAVFWIALALVFGGLGLITAGAAHFVRTAQQDAHARHPTKGISSATAKEG